jgi:hypothetical protein
VDLGIFRFHHGTTVGAGSAKASAKVEGPLCRNKKSTYMQNQQLSFDSACCV